MAATPHPVTTLDDVEELLRSSKEKGEEVPCCQLEADAAINAAVKLKAMVDSGAVRLVNQVMLANKLQAKATVEEGFKEIIDRTLFSPREMQALDESIAVLKNRLQIPYAVAYPESMEEEAIISEVQSQRVAWAMGLMGLEVEKEVLEEQAPKELEEFHSMLADALQTPSFMGSGSTDHKFLTHSGQLELDDME
ncbi:hypothetical protein CFC21_086544 [Triticum aestivum]|uniref:Trigger factor C-terminal domain-containing protein n=2 Tax=Triticum aestivum TaxID=4565 RepID=A0A9R1L9J2_WHEAT|nr:uncharacterized protein LOC119323622 [Triticum dicoccoides]XP_044410908.1 uncharacterized protein LOC123135761 [Triticum aestivum]KAF7082685.1 hypothetical protein CFC21_086544 [Triticum aestivum]